MIAGALRRFASSSVTPTRLLPLALRYAPAQLSLRDHVVRSMATKSDAPSLVAEVKPGKDGQIPDIMEQATGLERAEIDHPDLFKHNEVLRGRFGTQENPVMIQSAFDSRIVGCTGKAAPDDHDLVWINVEKGKLYTCPECGQVFQLDPL